MLKDMYLLFLGWTSYKMVLIHFILILIIIILYIKLLFTNKKLKNSKNVLNSNIKTNYAMLDISERAITTEDGNDMLNFILEKAIEVIGKTNKGSIMILNDDEKLEFIASKGFDVKDFKDSNLKLEDTFLWVKTNGVVKTPVIIDINDFYKNLNNEKLTSLLRAAQIENVKCTLSAPILIDDRLYGMLNLDSEIQNAYNIHDIKNIEGFTSMVGIILKHHEMLKKTIYRSKYDKLTNIYNRHCFEEIFKEVIIKANDFNMEFSVVVIDMDDLKYVNDRYGHLVGDELLKIFSNIVKENIRYSDIFARYGGDEFIGVFFKTKEMDIINKFEYIEDFLNKNPLIINDESIKCRFSYGISNYPDDSRSYNDLIKIADKRMYKNKMSKKSCV